MPFHDPLFYFHGVVQIVSKDKIQKAISKVFPNSKISSIKKLKKGMINENFEISIKNPDKQLILRIYPKEEWKAEKEEFLYNLISKKTDVPVPKIYLTDISKKILPNAFILCSKIEGQNLDVYYKKTGNKKIIEKAGEFLAKIHSIKFPGYGWIVGKNIEPKFSKWVDFVSYDMDEKLNKISKIKKIQKNIIYKIIDYYNKNKYLLDTKQEPSLLHKDYHFSHIFVKNNKISGIIDIEWAIAGNNELDLAKSKWFMFEKFPEAEKYFLNGYKRYGHISKKFDKREKLYKLILLVGLIGLSYEMKNTKWFNHNIKKIKEILK